MNAQFQKIIDDMPTRSAWSRGVKAYAFDMLQEMEENGITQPTKANLLNGAQDWNHVQARAAFQASSAILYALYGARRAPATT